MYSHKYVLRGRLFLYYIKSEQAWKQTNEKQKCNSHRHSAFIAFIYATLNDNIHFCSGIEIKSQLTFARSVNKWLCLMTLIIQLLFFSLYFYASFSLYVRFFVRNECQTVGHDFILNSDGEQTHYNYKCAPSRMKKKMFSFPMRDWHT